MTVLEQATEVLITGLRTEFGIIDDVHEEILEAVMTNTERPRKRCTITLHIMHRFCLYLAAIAVSEHLTR